MPREIRTNTTGPRRSDCSRASSSGSGFTLIRRTGSTRCFRRRPAGSLIQSGRCSSRRKSSALRSATRADWSIAPSIRFSRSGPLVTTNDLQFEEVWSVDFEFISKPGEHPDVVCLAARELRSGQTLRLWRDQLGALPPYRTDAGALFVCFVANAELACHLALGWPLPAKVLDGMSSEYFGQLAWQFDRMSGSSGLKVQAAIAC